MWHHFVAYIGIVCVNVAPKRCLYRNLGEYIMRSLKLHLSHIFNENKNIIYLVETRRNGKA